MTKVTVIGTTIILGSLNMIVRGGDHAGINTYFFNCYLFLKSKLFSVYVCKLFVF